MTDEKKALLPYMRRIQVMAAQLSEDAQIAGESGIAIETHLFAQRMKNLTERMEDDGRIYPLGAQ